MPKGKISNSKVIIWSHLSHVTHSLSRCNADQILNEKMILEGAEQQLSCTAICLFDDKNKNNIYAHICIYIIYIHMTISFIYKDLWKNTQKIGINDCL